MEFKNEHSIGSLVYVFNMVSYKQKGYIQFNINEMKILRPWSSAHGDRSHSRTFKGTRLCSNAVHDFDYKRSAFMRGEV